MAWYKKNMLFKSSMSNVDQSANKSELLGEDPITLMNLMRMKLNMTPLNSLMMMRFRFQDCCLTRWFGRFKGLIMAMQI